MEQRPREASRSTANQEISRSLWNTFARACRQ